MSSACMFNDEALFRGMSCKVAFQNYLAKVLVFRLHAFSRALSKRISFDVLNVFTPICELEAKITVAA